MSTRKGSKDLHLDLLNKISDHVQETTRTMASLDKKLDLHIQKTEMELQRIKETDDMQNKLLDQHIEGVQTLKKMYEAHELADVERFDKLQPKEIFKSLCKSTGKTFLKVFAVAGAIASALAGFAKLFHWF